MSQTDSSRNWKALRWVAHPLLTVAILESGGFILAVSAMAPPLLVILTPVIVGLSVTLYRWLCVRGLSATCALMCTSLAVVSWPWTTVLLIGWPVAPGPKGIDLAWLFGPLIPYAVIGAAGLAHRRRKTATT